MTILSRYELNEVEPASCQYFVNKPNGEEKVGSDRVIGIEVEVENHQLLRNPESGVWHMDNDGSLRNNGVEWISLPIPARWAPHALYELLITDLSQECCFSPRTSIHVHVNAQDLQPEQVIDATLLYAVVEPLLYRFTGRGRDKNIYCVPLYDTDLMNYISSRGLDVAMERWSKYTGLNLLPLREHGTMEFRHMHGTFDHQKISVWIRLLTKIIDYAAAGRTKEVRRTVLSMDRHFDYFSLFQEIFGDDLMYLKFTGYADVRQAVNNLRSAFNKSETLRDIIRLRDTEARYYKGSKA